MLFCILDFAGCTKNITAWKYLAKYLRRILIENHLACSRRVELQEKNGGQSFTSATFGQKVIGRKIKIWLVKKLL
jgi:TATA box-binding protein-associated factor RNA polymerase I subunit A